MENNTADQPVRDTDYIYNTSIFSGFKRIIQSKNFRGGELTLIFGGVELDLSFADLTSPTVINITQAFGEVKLFLPGNWRLVDETTHFLSVLKDHRYVSGDTNPDINKTLILRGFSTFAAVEVLTARIANI